MNKFTKGMIINGRYKGTLRCSDIRGQGRKRASQGGSEGLTVEKSPEKEVGSSQVRTVSPAGGVAPPLLVGQR